MNKKKFIFIVILVSVLAATIITELPKLHSKPAAVVTRKTVIHSRLSAVPVHNPHLLRLIDDYEKEVRGLMLRSQTPGAAIAIVKDSAVIYLKGWGVKTAGTHDSVDTETVFRLGSVSKCFAPILTGLLVEDHLLSWDDKVVKYLPDFNLHSKEQTDQLRIKHVLSHTTGLPYHAYTNLIEEGTPLPTMLSRLREIDMIGNVGKVYSYQNVAYSLISEVVHTASGKSYEELMTERIFKPLHMDNASISYADIMKNQDVALPHMHTRRGLTPAKISNTYYNVAPAGGVNASISDMAQWIEAILGNRQNLINDSVLNVVFRPVIRAPSKNHNFRKWVHPTGSYYALGWRVLYFKNDTLYYHGGYVNGYRSELAISRRDKIGICILTNCTGELADNSTPYFFNLYLNRRDSIQAWEDRHRIENLIK